MNPAPPTCLSLSPDTPNIREANLDWFRNAKFGLFMHYGLYSLLEGRWENPWVDYKGAEWIQWWAPVPRREYMALQQKFTAEKFDADAICRLAVDAGMTYVNLTTQHHDGFSLWDTQTNDYSSMHAPAGRDLVAELTAACARHRLGWPLLSSDRPQNLPG